MRLSLALCLPLALLLACTGDKAPAGDSAATSGDDSTPPTGTTDSAPPTDADGDGVAAELDCDDANPAVYPDAAEVCDGADNDCDGAIDEDPTDGVEVFTDADGDGWGADPAVGTACAAGVGQSASGGDCDDGNPAYYPEAPEADCEDPNDYNCDGSVGYADADGDGYAACAECDDAAPAINPSATELCDGVDQDCSGTADDGAIDAGTWYADLDGDGHGDPDAATASCEAPTGYVDADTDCDDAAAAVHPGADERCDGVDEDCDGTIDEDALDAPTWYLDGDGDGDGDPNAAAASCEAPPGHVPSGTDCDDANASTNPTAPELCNTADDDCDGVIDEDDALDAASWYLDADLDGYGDPTAPTLACAAPDGHVADGTDCDDDDATAWPGADELCDGADDDCDGVIDEDDALDAPTWYLDADLDGDGDPAMPAAACAAPAGYVASLADCDDTDAAVNTAASELCNDVDDDCDGTIDENGAADAPTWYADGDQDGYGDPNDPILACALPDGYVADATDCDDANWTANPGQVEACNGQDDDCDGEVDEADANDVADWHPDLDGDGYGDPAVTVSSCAAPDAHVLDATDCDDTTANHAPNVTETCNGVDDDCDGEIDESSAADAATWYQDDDADGYGQTGASVPACAAPAGYASASGDCADADATRNPGAAEVCDAIDNDCDGAADPSAAVDAATWYADLDEDRYGDPGSSVVACYSPAGYRADGTDCDDGDASINPGETEICDGLDNDCDALTDDDDLVDPSTATAWYADADLDGYGDPGVVTAACRAPAGYVGDALDCDDADAAVSPAGAESCNDYDDDCDGAIDEAGALGEATWYEDADADGYGHPDVTTVACDAPAGYAATDTDCHDARADINPGAAELCDGSDGDCDGTIDDGFESSFASFSWDEDGDGFGDASNTVQACLRPAGYAVTERWEDCDDADPTVHPFAWEDTADGVDNDCDGAADGVDGTTVSYLSTGTTGYLDDAGTLITIASFAFPFCGTDRTSAYMQSNGRLTFGSSDTSYLESYTNFQSDTGIAVMWDDLVADDLEMATVDYGDAMGFYWVDVTEYHAPVASNLAYNSNTFSVVLFDDGRFLLDYGGLDAVDGLAGFSCLGSATEADLTADWAALTAGATGLGTGLETMVYEVFTSNGNDLEDQPLWLCGQADAAAEDADGDGWTAACGDRLDDDASAYPR